MSQTFLAGSKLRLWRNSYRLSKITDTFDLKRMCDTYDVTTHETDGNRAFISGLRSGGSDKGGIYDASTDAGDERVASQLGSTSISIYTAAIEGDAVGKIAHVWQAREKQVNISSPANGRIGWQGGDDASDHVLSGRMLRQGTAPTASTGASAAVDNAAATTHGGVGHFHLTDLVALGSITVKIQHSSAASVWADLLTWTTTSTGASHQSTTGTAIKRYTRSIVTALSGSTYVPLAVAFARNTD